MCARSTKVCIIILMCAGLTASLYVIFERVRVAYINEKYIEHAFINVSRLERRGDYNINFEFIMKYPFSKDLLIHFLFYEFLSYRYERSFVEFHFNLCDAINDPLLGLDYKRQGLQCPLIPGKLYSFKNYTTHMDDFPNVFPFDKGLIKVILQRNDTNKSLVSETFIYVSFKNTKKGKKRN